MPAFRFHPEAELEIQAALDWYEDQVPGLGAEFLEELKRILDLTADTPLLWPVWPGVETAYKVRRALLSRFPFGVAYLLVGEEIRIYAVAHLSRKPGYWKDRRIR